MIKTFVIKCQYATSTGTAKIILHKKLEASALKTIRAKLFEGCLEATFQVIACSFSIRMVKKIFGCKNYCSNISAVTANLPVAALFDCKDKLSEIK